jgi:hypothetical protein
METACRTIGMAAANAAAIHLKGTGKQMLRGLINNNHDKQGSITLLYVQA